MTSWLIELNLQHGVIWWAGARTSDNWTSNHASAVRFARREDAEYTIAYLHIPALAVEHQWLTP